MRPDIEAIRARCEAATPGPWVVEDYYGWRVRAKSIVDNWGTHPTVFDDGSAHEEYGPQCNETDRDFLVAARTDIPALLAYIDELERDLLNERATFESCNRARMHCEYECATLKARTTYTVGETEWAHRIAVAEQRFVDEYDAHQETRKLLTDVYMQQLRADAAQMRKYGISYDGVRRLITDYLDDELSLGKVVELLRAAARELAKEELVKLKEEQ